MDWTYYLQSIREDPKLSPLREVYTITTVEGETARQKVLNAAPLLFDFGLMVERAEEKQDQERQEQERKQVERLGVLEGLRKYAKDHVLLQGKPGSGKSTALRRLLLEEAETVNQVPVLIELKFYEESIVGLIREFLGRHGTSLSNAEIIEALENGEFLLLVDGGNELPSEAARRDLDTFRSRYQKSTAMIFTTRDLGLGGNLGIEKKLEMLPLSESQMRDFVCAYLPDTGEVMLGTLREKLRELGKTPLLLKMLCDLYGTVGTIPENLGLIFRAFTAQYENHPELKGKVPLEVSSKSFWGDLLQEIAFRMMQGNDDPKEIAVAIPKSEAEKIIWEFCKSANLPNSLGDVRQWLEELLAYHLIELEGQNQITFCHQLIQEYYAAEKLLKLLPELDDQSLKWDYLNYLKWTESIKLMCALIKDSKQAHQLISLSLDIDYFLGLKIIKSVKKDFQKQGITKIKAPIQI
jgi:predicted NACHT family NTPase